MPTGTVDASIVFVHGSWASRVSARLASTGMRRDSIETALRRNDICVVHGYALARAAGTSPPTELDFEALPGTPGSLTLRELSSGNLIRVAPSRVPTASCAREARADRLGSIELEPLLWQAPPLQDVSVMVARDLGPLDNTRLLEDLGRTPYLYVEIEGVPSLMEYAAGMELLWGAASPAGG
jgi:hypothetical protein